MATTTNFGWTTPDDTSLVKDGAAAIRTLGQSIDTSMADLEGGTTGQVLAKNTNADMDFVWVAQDDSNAIQNAIVDAKGDLISATAADTPARLGVGTNNQVLMVDSTTATGLKWATLAASTPTNAVATIATEESTTSTSYTDLATAGPAVTLTTGTKALVIISTAFLRNDNNSTSSFISVDVSGATTVAAADSKALLLSTTSTGNSRPELGYTFAYIATGLTAGSNTFTCKYRVSGGTMRTNNRIITVIDMGS